VFFLRIPLVILGDNTAGKSTLATALDASNFFCRNWDDTTSISRYLGTDADCNSQYYFGEEEKEDKTKQWNATVLDDECISGEIEEPFCNSLPTKTNPEEKSQECCNQDSFSEEGKKQQEGEVLFESAFSDDKGELASREPLLQLTRLSPENDRGQCTVEYSLEQLNYFRICSVAINLVPVGLRQIFKKEWDFRYRTTLLGEWNGTPQNSHDFYHNESKRSRAKNARYLATIQNGDTAEWDCGCLFFAILYSESIGTTLSQTVSTAIAELRQVRNDIAHITEAELTDAEFQNYVGRVLHAFTSLGLPINDIEDVRNQTSFPTMDVADLKKRVCYLKTELNQEMSDLNQSKSDFEEAKNALQNKEAALNTAKEENKSLIQELSSKLEPFCFLTLKPPHEVIRRSNDVKRLTNKMQELYKDADGAVSTIYLTGNPGCGKSQLARQLGTEIFSKRSDDAEDIMFVATLNAESIDTLADSYFTLGRHLGIIEYTLTSLETSKREKPSDAITQLQRLILPKVRKYRKWIIIVDNVVDLTSVCGFLPQTGSEEWGRGQVLITTEENTTIPLNAPYTYHESFSKGMQPDDAVELLEKVSQISDREQAENVAKVLDYQPLGLAAAACYVQMVVKNGSTNYSWADYLEGLTHSQREANESFLASESSVHAKRTLTAIAMALQKAVATDEVLRQTFSFLALCSSEVTLLEAVVMFVRSRTTNKPEDLIKAEILRSSLILVSAEKEVERQYLGLHNIVHTVLRQSVCNLESSERYQNMAEAVKIFKSLLVSEHEDYALLNKLTSHCKSLLEHMATRLTSLESFVPKHLSLFIAVDEVVDWLGSVADACKTLSDFCSAKYVVDLACSLLENVSNTEEGASLKSRIFNMSELVYCHIGKHNQAKEFKKKTLVIRKKLFGEEHSGISTSCSSLATVNVHIGKHSQAKDLCSDVAITFSNFAWVHYSIGAYDEAKASYERALVVSQHILSEEHPVVATIYNNLAIVCINIGDYNQARKALEKALTIQKKIFGEEHSDVATSYGNLAGVYLTIGKYNQAKELYEKALMIRKKIFGEEHSSVATSWNNLAEVYYSIGEDNQAEQLRKKALMIQSIYSA